MTQQYSGNATRFTPNRFELKHQFTKITYDATAIDGQPHLYYQVLQGPATRTFSGDQIRLRQTEIGTLVTVTLEAIADGQSILLTILLPTINLVGTTEQTFETVGIITTEQGSIAGPGLVSGAVQSYQTMQLDGTAQYVLT